MGWYQRGVRAHTPRMIRDGVPVANARSSTHGLMVEVLVDGQFGYYGTPDMTPEGVSLAAKHAFQQAKIASKNSLYSLMSRRPSFQGEYKSPYTKDAERCLLVI